MAKEIATFDEEDIIEDDDEIVVTKTKPSRSKKEVKPSREVFKPTKEKASKKRGGRSATMQWFLYGAIAAVVLFVVGLIGAWSFISSLF